jgi:plasmid stabilization system protein ParE
MDTTTTSPQWTDWESEPEAARVRVKKFGVWVLEEREVFEVSGEITHTTEIYPSKDVESFADPEEAQAYARDLLAATDDLAHEIERAKVERAEFEAVTEIERAEFEAVREISEPVTYDTHGSAFPWKISDYTGEGPRLSGLGGELDFATPDAAREFARSLVEAADVLGATLAVTV